MATVRQLRNSLMGTTDRFRGSWNFWIKPAIALGITVTILLGVTLSRNGERVETYTADAGPVNPQVPLSITNGALQVVPVLNGHMFEVYHDNKHVTSISLGANEVTYDGVLKNLFSSVIWEYAWFNDEEDKRELARSQTDQSYRLATTLSGKATDVTSARLEFEIPKANDYLKVQLFARSPDPSKLGGVAYMLTAPLYDTYLPSGQILRNDNATSFLNLQLAENYVVLYDSATSNALIVTAQHIRSFNNSFYHQVHKVLIANNFLGVVEPIYFFYVSQAMVSYEEGSLQLETPNFKGPVEKYIYREIHQANSN